MTATAPHARNMPADAILERGGVRFVRPTMAKAMVEDAQRRGVDVLGLDAFFLTDHATQPSLENSATFTGSAGSDRNNHERALAHLNGRLPEDIFFELVLTKT